MRTMLAAVALALIPALPTAAAEPPARSAALKDEPRTHPQGLYAVTPAASLELVLPATWGTGWRSNDDGRPDSALFAPDLEKGFTLLVSPFPAPPSALGPQGSRELAEKLGSGLGGKAGPVQEFRGERRIVHWFATPTKSSGTTGFTWLTAGATALDDIVVTFNLLHDAEEPPDRALVLQALGRARQIDPQKTRVAGTVALASSGKSWALLVNVPGLKLDSGGGKPDGSAKVEGHSEETGLVASIFLLPAPGPGGPAECRAALFDKAVAGQLEKAGVVRFERGAVALGEYSVPPAEGLGFPLKHVDAYLVRDGVWMGIRLSKDGFRPSDQVLIDRVLASIRFSDR
jgi:hypothetical protein